MKENSEFTPVKLCLKIDLVSHPVHVEGLGKYTRNPLDKAISLGEGKSEFKPIKLHLKIDLVSHPVHVEGLGEYTRNPLDKAISLGEGKL